MQVRKQNHAVYKTQYHLILVTRYRRKILANKSIKSYLKIILKEVTQHYPDLAYKEIGMDEDHVHLQVVIPPKYAVSKMVNVIKSNSSNALTRKFKSFLSDVYYDKKGIWSRGYFVSTVGLDEETIQNYVRRQGEEDAPQEYFLASLTAQTSSARHLNTPPVRVGFFMH
jgi:putative transposase